MVVAVKGGGRSFVFASTARCPLYFVPFKTTEQNVKHRIRWAGDEADKSEIDGDGRLATVSTHTATYNVSEIANLHIM